jgi:hypothetical protein
VKGSDVPDSFSSNGGKIMAIRFSCPSCNQPIEIEDTWAGQSVACPYCKNVVAAPAESNWPPDEVQMAAPTTSAFAPPPPPSAPTPAPQMEAWAPRPAPARSPSAGWALALAIISALLAVFGWIAWFGSIVGPVMEKLGPSPTEQEIQKEFQELVSSGQVPPNPTVAVIGIVGLLCAIGGVVLGIWSILRSEPRRIMAVIACVIGACFLFCQVVLTSIALMGGQAMAAG